MERNEMTEKEAKVYDFCIKMGDSHELAVKSVEMERKKPENTEFYRFAYEG